MLLSGVFGLIGQNDFLLCKLLLLNTFHELVSVQCLDDLLAAANKRVIIIVIIF